MSTSPSSKIDLDSLLLIFEIITRRMPKLRSVFDQRTHRSTNSSTPLTDIRAASQVCRLWRQSLLASPRIWGRVIDLDVLCFGTAKTVGWLEEVVSRAGSSSPLWISGNVIESKWDSKTRISDTQKFFIRLLGTEWERIEQLVVVIHGQSIHNAIQTRFLTRAPILKVFEVDMPSLGSRERLFEDPLRFGIQNEHGTNGSSQRYNLFANCAPALRTINLDWISIDTESSWLPRILQMSFTPSHRLSMNDFFGVLQRAHNLTKVTLDTRFSALATPQESLPTQVHLPNLSSLFLITTLPHCARLLDHISPGKLRKLWIRIADSNPAPLSQNIVTSFEQNLPVLISNYFRANIVMQLRLMVLTSSIVFHNSHQNDEDHESFELAMLKFGSNINQDDTDRTIACLLDTVTLASSCSDSTPSMTIHTMGGAPRPGPEIGCFESITDFVLDITALRSTLFMNVRRALAEFRKVRSVRVPEGSLRNFYSLLCSDQPAASEAGGSGGECGPHITLFPDLHTLYLIPAEYGNNTFNGRDNEYVTTLPQILTHRKKIGFPISRIDLTGCGPSFYSGNPDLSALEEVDGLEVVWERRALE